MEWDKIRKEWEEHQTPLKELAEKHGVKLGSLKSRKSREKWGSEVATQKTEKVATTKKVATPKKPRYPNGHPGNKNPEKKFQERNQAAKKHGLFSRYMPKETLEIMNQMEGVSEADLIWTQIQIQFAALIRSQEIMLVESKDEIIREVKKERSSRSDLGSTDETEYEIQFSWDRQAKVLNSQAVAMSEIRASIRQFLNLAHEEDERRLKLENMQSDINLKQAKLKALGGDNSTEDKLMDYFERLEEAFKDES